MSCVGPWPFRVCTMQALEEKQQKLQKEVDRLQSTKNQQIGLVVCFCLYMVSETPRSYSAI